GHRRIVRRWAFAAAAAVILGGLALLLPALRDQPAPAPLVVQSQPDGSAENKDRVAELTGAGVVTPRPRATPPAAPTAAIGDTITTRAKENRRVALPDGSVLYLNQNTVVKIEAERRVILSAGEIFVEVSPPEPDRDGATFTVRTANREARALGTK